MTRFNVFSCKHLAASSVSMYSTRESRLLEEPTILMNTLILCNNQAVVNKPY